MTLHNYRDLKDFLGLYRDTCEWFTSIGFEWAGTRYGTYEKHFYDFERAAESGDEPSVNIDVKRAFDNSYLEANEIVRVYSDLKHIDQSGFHEQLKKVLSGQEYRGQVDNDQARDFLFELSTAARFLRAGFEVELTGVCDIVAEIPEGTLYIECKRMKSLNKIPKNIKKATEQIKKRIGRNPSTKLLGLVAANVTDLVISPTFLSPDSPEAATELHRTLSNKFLGEQFRELTPKSTSKRLLGTMVESSSMWYLSERSPVSGLAYTRHTNFIQLAMPEIIEKLGPRICNQDIAI
jgi:hypothetical protein